MVGRSILATFALLCSWACGQPEEIGPADCTIPEQNRWLDELMHEVYLWNDEIPAVDPATYDDPESLLDALLAPLDRWSYINTEERDEKYFVEGKFLGLGYRRLVTADGPSFVGFVYPDSSAGAAGVVRGDRIVAVGGVPTEQLDDEDSWDSVWGADEAGVTVVHEFERADGTRFTADLVRDWVSIATVPAHTVLDGGIGYLMFSSFVETAYEPLDDAFAEFERAGVDRLVIDLRYNGGGRLDVAQYFLDLMVGADHDGDVSYQVRHNADLIGDDKARYFTRRDASLGVRAVAFLTTRSTASASELLINALLPWIPTYVIGGTTTGKPVGSYTYRFCEKALHPISFRLANADDASDYFGGFAPDCTAADDYTAPLGDPGEASLAAGLALLAGQACPETPAAAVIARPEPLRGIEALAGAR